MADVDILEAPVAPAGGAATDASQTSTGTQAAGTGSQQTQAADKSTETTASSAQTTATDTAQSRSGRRSTAAAPSGDKPATTDAAAADGTATDDLDFDDGEGDGKAPAAWPDDWRQRLAGNDPKWLKELERFTSFETFAKSQRALRQKLSSGEYKRAQLPENATDAEKTEWRKENGIPEKPEEYGLPEVKGHQWTEADTPIVNDFLTTLHAAGTPKPIAEQALRWYAGFQQQQAEMRSQIDRQAVEEREDALRADWGREYRAHVNLARETIQDDTFISPDLRQALASARMADGRRLIHHPDFTRFLAEQGLSRRGPGGLVSGEQGARMGSRLDEINKIMATDIDKYYQDGLDKERLELMEKMGSARSR